MVTHHNSSSCPAHAVAAPLDPAADVLTIGATVDEGRKLVKDGKDTPTDVVTGREAVVDAVVGGDAETSITSISASGVDNELSNEELRIKYKNVYIYIFYVYFQVERRDKEKFRKQRERERERERGREGERERERERERQGGIF